MSTDVTAADVQVDKPHVDLIGFVSDNYLAICVALAVVALSFTGVGNAFFVCVTAVVLCVAILGKRSMRLDLWVFLPLLAYMLLSMYASFRIQGSFAGGFAGVQVVLLAIYLAIASMENDEARLARQLCVAWIVLASAIAIALFVLDALGGVVSRLSWPLTGANAVGIFLVIGWFALAGLDDESILTRILKCFEPAVLVALALTLSLGSFGALVFGLVAMLLYRKRGRSWAEVLSFAAVTIVKLAIAMGTGLLLYLAPSWGDAPWFDIVIFLYVVALAVLWPALKGYLQSHMRLTAPLAILGPVLACVAFLVRGSAPATFYERLQMMQNGVGYLSVDPLFGIGPYQWRTYNMLDADIYFNTWHIHNSLLHVSVELGLIAALMLVIIAVRFFVKRRDPDQRGGFIAFIVHNMMDTSFFFPSVTCLLMVSVASPRTTGAHLDGAKGKFVAIGVTVLCAILLLSNIPEM